MSSAASVSSSGVVVPGVQLPQVDVVGAQPAAARRRARRAGARARCPTTHSPVRRGDARLGREHDLVAATTSAEQPRRAPARSRRRRRRRRCRPACRPPRGTRRAASAASCSSVSRPQVMVPRPSRDTAGRCGRGDAAPWRANASRPVRADRRRGTVMRTCELGLNLGYWGAGNDADNLALAQEADRLGYAVGLGRRGLRLRRRHRARLGRPRRPSASTSARRSSRSRPHAGDDAR